MPHIRLLLVTAGVVSGCAASRVVTSSTVIITTDGAVQGFVENGIMRFLGIPYAAPPVGALRWKPPQRHVPWSGVRSTNAYGPTCAQVTTLGVFAGPANENEDCLYLNVFAPRVGSGGKEKLPVIVWIHGGGTFCGESNDYDASKLAMQGQTVVVTFNYRLGLLGWLAHPALNVEGHPFANYGLLDQQFVLEWVERNIAAFGGDKARVTLGGQSAGSQSTEANMASPLARGLFQRAILQSTVEEPMPLPAAESAGRAFAVAAGCGSEATAAVAHCLRDLSVARILALSGTASTVGPYVTGPIADGQILPRDGFAAAFKQGRFNRVPVVTGTTSDEANLAIAVAEYFSGPPRVPVTASDFRTDITGKFSDRSSSHPGGTVDQVFEHYPLRSYATPQLALDATRTDFRACTQRKINRLLASQVPVYAYEFQDRTAPFYFPELPQFQPLAYHTADIAYYFPGFRGGPLGTPHPLDRQQAKLSDELVTLWANFARSGNPNGSGSPVWPRYDLTSGQPAYYLAENIPQLSTFTDAQFSAAHQCDFWDRILRDR